MAHHGKSHHAKTHHAKTHDTHDDEPNTLAIKLGTVALTFAAGWIVQRVLVQTWKGVTGKDAPKDIEDPEVSIVSAVAFAAATAGVGVLVRRLASRNAKRVVTRLVQKR